MITQPYSRNLILSLALLGQTKQNQESPLSKDWGKTNSRYYCHCTYNSLKRVFHLHYPDQNGFHVRPISGL